MHDCLRELCSLAAARLEVLHLLRCPHSGGCSGAPVAPPAQAHPVPGYAAVSTAQTPIVPPPAPAPLSAAPVDEPVSSEWPETLGERPSLRSALAATEVPAPTPPREEAPAPEGEDDAEPEPTRMSTRWSSRPARGRRRGAGSRRARPGRVGRAVPRVRPLRVHADRPRARARRGAPVRRRVRSSRRRAAAASGTLLEEAPEFEDDVESELLVDDDDDVPRAAPDR